MPLDQKILNRAFKILSKSEHQVLANHIHIYFGNE
ncbi:MAG: hypothetical protein ACJA04_000180 [Cellvibrionaceae bacterium]|jgi:hypothetical protein